MKIPGLLMLQKLFCYFFLFKDCTHTIILGQHSQLHIQENGVNSLKVTVVGGFTPWISKHYISRPCLLFGVLVYQYHCLVNYYLTWLITPLVKIQDYIAYIFKNQNMYFLKLPYLIKLLG